MRQGALTLCLLLVLSSGTGAQARVLNDWQFFTAKGWSLEPRMAWVMEYPQPDVYARWWREIAACEGLQLPPDIDRVQFYVVNAALFQPQGYPKQVLGMTYPARAEIYVGIDYVLRERLVKHEMLHFILAWNGKHFGNYHPPEYFETCGIHEFDSP